MSGSKKGDAEKARYWRRTISEAARSGMSIRAFCRQRRLRQSQFYWWQHKLRASRQAGTTPKAGSQGRLAGFALVSDEAKLRSPAPCCHCWRPRLFSLRWSSPPPCPGLECLPRLSPYSRAWR
jgi:hypothetical protein